MSPLYDEVTIRIRPIEGVIKVEEHTGGIMAVKNISPDDLVESFVKGVKESKTIRSGFLPENCISCDVNTRQRTLALWLPPGYIDFTYHHTVYEHFLLPAMVFSFQVNIDGKTSNHRMAIMADEKPAPNTQLYVYPFSNTYADSRICIGAANSLPVYKNLRTLTTLPHLILSLPNNDHNFNRTNNKLKLGYRELLDHLQDKKPAYYYEHVLLPWEGKTLQHFIDKEL